MEEIIDVSKKVKEFVALWDESVEKRVEAAKLYYDCTKDHPERKAEFHAAYPQWSALAWKRLYEIGAGNVSPELVDLHNWALTIRMSGIPVKHQTAIAKGGLRAYSSDHRGGVTVQLKNLTTPILNHVYDSRTGQIKSVEAQRKTPLTNRVKKESVQYLKVNGNIVAKVTRGITIDATMATELLLHGILSPKDLRSIAAKLEAKG